MLSAVIDDMTAERFQEIEAKGGIVDLSDRAKFRLTGSDRVRYLNGQVTNDVRAADQKETLYACVTDIKGRIVGDIFIHAAAAGDALLFDAEADLREVLGPRLERYIIADDAELADVTGDWRLWHAFGAGSRGQGAGSDLPAGVQVLKARRLGVDGADIWMPVNASGSMPPAPCSLPLLSAEEFEELRILRGVPRHPKELNGATFPPEAGLDERAMSYTKGCYIGQEVLSRIRTTGKMPRELVRWQAAEEGKGIDAGARVASNEDGGEAKEAGEITSVAWDPLLERQVGLAYLKQAFAGSDSQLLVSSHAPSIGAKIEIFPVVER